MGFLKYIYKNTRDYINQKLFKNNNKFEELNTTDIIYFMVTMIEKLQY
jgi:hypothetical protein